MIPTICAAYLRKSTKDERAASDKLKSVKRQEEEIRAYVKRKGWVLPDHLVFSDDAVSGGEWDKRKEFQRMLALLPKGCRKPPFEVLVMVDPSRFGRDQERVPYYLAHLRDSGVRSTTATTTARKSSTRLTEVLMSRSYAFEVGEARRDPAVARRVVHRRGEGLRRGRRRLRLRRTCACSLDGDTATKKAARRLANQRRAGRRRSAHLPHVRGDGYGHPTIARRSTATRATPTSRERTSPGAARAAAQGHGSWAGSSVRAMLINPRYTGVDQPTASGGRLPARNEASRAPARRGRQRVERGTCASSTAVVARGEARLAAAERTSGHERPAWTPGTGRVEVPADGPRAVRQSAAQHHDGRRARRQRGRATRSSTTAAPPQESRRHGLRQRPARALGEADALVIERSQRVLDAGGHGLRVDKARGARGREADERADEPERLDAEAARLRKELDRFLRADRRGRRAASVAGAGNQEARVSASEIEAERAALATVALPSPSWSAAAEGVPGAAGADSTSCSSPTCRAPARRSGRCSTARSSSGPRSATASEGYRLRWPLATTALLGRLSWSGVPTGIRTPVIAVKGRCPRPLDDGDHKQIGSRGAPDLAKRKSVWWR